MRVNLIRGITQFLALSVMLAPVSIVRADVLLGYCSPVPAQCIEGGLNSPTNTNPPSSFGFTASQGQAIGDLVLVFLAPNNLDPNPSTVHIGLASITGTANLFSGTPWTSGSLDTYLGISASSANPIEAFLPSTQFLDAGAIGFFVYQVDLGTTILQDPGDPHVSPIENLNISIPIGSYIVGFLNEGTMGSPNWSATLDSGAIFETSGPGGCTSCTFGGLPIPESSTPEPSYMFLLVMFGGVMFFARRRLV